jgi:DNA-directed RNA polymerase subunit RPC12/RpoP
MADGVPFCGRWIWKCVDDVHWIEGGLMYLHQCPACQKTITFAQPLRRNTKLACPYCNTELRSHVVSAEGHYSAYITIARR